MQRNLLAPDADPLGAQVGPAGCSCIENASLRSKPLEIPDAAEIYWLI